VNFCATLVADAKMRAWHYYHISGIGKAYQTLLIFPLLSHPHYSLILAGVGLFLGVLESVDVLELKGNAIDNDNLFLNVDPCDSFLLVLGKHSIRNLSVFLFFLSVVYYEHYRPVVRVMLKQLKPC